MILHSTSEFADAHVSASSKNFLRSVSWVWAVAAALGASALLVLTEPTLWHWFMIPICLSAALVGVDAVEWVRGRLDPLEPRALIALLGLYLFCVVPVLHVVWQEWPAHVAGARDWRHSFGVLATVNLTGLLIYRAVLALPPKARGTRRLELMPRRFTQLCIVTGVAGLVTYFILLYRFGGLSGYLDAITSPDRDLDGYGWFLLFAEAWPLLALTATLAVARGWLTKHTMAVILLIVAFALLQFFVGGLRGSRSNTIWPVMMAVVMIHLIVRPIRKRALIAGGLVVVSFMYVYGFYKESGREAIEMLVANRPIEHVATSTGRTVRRLALEDFGRAGVQAIIVDRQSRAGQSSIYYGSTYIGDVSKLLPSAIEPPGIPDKIRAGTDVLYGAGASSTGFRSSRIYGLVGEGMLNFGLLGGVLAFIPFALFVRLSTRVYHRALDGSVSAALIAPSLSVATILALGSDLDNVIWFLVKQSGLLAVLILLGSRSVPNLRSRSAELELVSPSKSPPWTMATRPAAYVSFAHRRGR